MIRCMRISRSQAQQEKTPMSSLGDGSLRFALERDDSDREITSRPRTSSGSGAGGDDPLYEDKSHSPPPLSDMDSVDIERDSLSPNPVPYTSAVEPLRLTPNPKGGNSYGRTLRTRSMIHTHENFTF